MEMFRRISVALSMTETDSELLRYAALVARLGVSVEFRFVHVVPARSGNGTPLEALEESMAAEVRAHFTGAPDDLDWSCHVCEGDRVDRLIEFVIEQKSNLVLLGHRRSRRGQRSLARRLAMISPCSVWMVPQGAPGRIQNILAPVDFSEHSADSLSQAAAIARLQGLEECLALHVYFDASPYGHDEHAEQVRGDEQLAFRQFLRPVNTHGVAIQPLFRESPSVSGAILECARERDVDLIVMSTRGRSRASAILLGSETTQTMVESPLPVLAVKHYGAYLHLYEALCDPRRRPEPSLQFN